MIMLRLPNKTSKNQFGDTDWGPPLVFLYGF
jgi:hypothetical protein